MNLNKQMYELVYNDDVPNLQFYIDYFELLPSRKTIRGEFNTDFIKYFTDNGFEIKSILEVDNSYSQNIKSNIKALLVNDETKIVVNIKIGEYYDNKFKGSIDIMYNYTDGYQSIIGIIDEVNDNKKSKSEFNIKLIRSENGYIDTEEFELQIPNINLELSYGIEFMKKHNIIVESLKKKDNKGIVLLHGESGTGKTTYIKYLTSLLGDKNIIFIPPSMAEVLSEPSIIPFLMENKNSILVIEDGEKVISDRELNKSYAAGVSNILNITDGILGDCLKIQVLVTFNMEKEKIDKALLRNGRLICEHKFEALSVEESNELLKHLNKNFNTTKKMTVADIYNIDSSTYRDKVEKKSVGFY